MISSPYNLKTHSSDPTKFYTDLSYFTDKVIETGMPTLLPLIEEFMEFSANKDFKRYTPHEHLMELLMAGLFWKNYYLFLSKKVFFYEPIFDKLYQWRKKYTQMKPQLDAVRGKLSYRILTQNRNHQIPLEERFKYLISWLNCSKEFNQELERLTIWEQFLNTKPTSFSLIFWNLTCDFADWFVLESAIHLSDYTENWEDFIIDTFSTYKKREDFIFCTRKPSEYYLNMVAAEIMNRSLKPAFSKTANKILLLPTCMTKSPKCKAAKKGNNIICSHCNPECQVSKITLRLNKEGVNTVLIPHSSGFSEFLKPWQNSSDTALIGVACVLNLITGGYEMQKLNIPSQCVFLDACGCKKHWLSGEPTELNENQLLNVIINERIEQPVNSTC